MFKKSCYWLIGFCILNLSATLLANNNKTLDKVYEQHAFTQMGEATFSILFWDLYKSKLLTTTGRYPINIKFEHLIYEINYLADISKKDLIKRTVEQWQHIDIKESLYTPYLETLNQIWPDIESGDTLTLVLTNGTTEFYFNGVYIGQIIEPAFGPLFLDIWLSEKTSQPELRTDLLGITQ
ncbi:chalcone isomerase family protein [Algibacillus agarilyticus]|uniref:chalcone isomerase family protein n=1 Tax=Algibacillus agarilyticus TaxID=2234133 RepID=UPI001E323AD9|nr:chalcone isomerase family protein [Algibacillus agarilyticus]